MEPSISSTANPERTLHSHLAEAAKVIPINQKSEPDAALRANVCEHSENTDYQTYECQNDAIGTCMYCGIDICDFCLRKGYCYVGSHHVLKTDAA